MGSIYKYRVKTILGDRGNLFWTLIFPILMATLFYFTFGSLLTETDDWQGVRVAVVEQSENSYFTELVDELSKGGDAVLHAQAMGMDEALAQLESEEIDGIYEVAGQPALVVKNQGVGQSILKDVLDSYLQIESTATNIAQQDPALVAQAVQELAQPEDVVEHITLGEGNFNFWRENFYSLIAMTCLFASFFGLTGATNIQPGMSHVGARRSVTPTPKLKMILSDTLATITVMFAVLLVLLAFLVGALRIDLGDNVGAILLTTLCGVFVGVMFGSFIGLAVRSSQGVKDGILVGSTLVLCFLSGLMYPNVRMMVERSAPIVNRINPAALMVDSFYALDTYGMGERYWMNIVLMAVIGTLLCVGSAAILRRKQYASL